MAFTDIFIRRPILAIVVSLLIFFIGLRSLMSLDVRQFPKFDSASISITTTYPGASPSLMQGFITTPIEQAISTAEGIDYVIATSSQSQSKITAYIKLGYNSNTAMVDIMSKVQQVKNQIPREANDPIILKTNTNGMGTIYVGCQSDELSTAQITDYVTRVVEPVLSTVSGVGSIDLLGGQPFAMRLWVDSDRMAARGITGEDLQKALLANNVQSAPGQAKGLFTIINITTNTALEDVDQFSNMVVKATNGTVVRMHDIATVELDAQSVNSSVMLDNKLAIMVGVNPTPSGNPLVIADGVRKRLAALQHDLPPGLKMFVHYDTSLFVQASIDEVVATIIKAVATVIVVIFLSLGTLRAVVIPIVTIPLAMVGAASLMLAIGFSINLLTLLAMVLAVGLVVDDAIVVVENVYRHIREGHTPVQAALIGARELVSAIVVMTVTLAAVYAPIGLLSGVTGTLFREFAFTLAGSVIISGVVALTLSPMLSSVLLTREMSDGRFPHFVEHIFDRLAQAYAQCLKGTLDYRSAILLFAAAVLASLFFLYDGAKKELAPTEDQGFLIIQLKAPQYANIDYLSAFARKGVNLMKDIPEVARRHTMIGSASQNTGSIAVVMKPWDQRSRTTTDILASLAPGLTAGLTGVRTIGTFPPSLPASSGGAPVQMVISSVNGYETIFRVMEEIKQAAQKSGLFVATDSDLDFNAPEIRLKVDAAKANALGVNMQNIASTLAALVGENYVNRFSMSGRSYQVIPQVPREERLNADTLTQYYVTAANGQQVPLSTVVSYELGSMPNANTEYNQLNSATFSGVPMPGVSMGDAVAFMEKTAKELLPEGFSHDYLGDSRQYVTEGNALVATFGFALIIIYLVLAAQFESLRDPLVVLVSVPMSICGALIPLYFGSWIQGTFHVVGATINIYTQVGLVTLIGLISKHGILMVTFANDMQRRDGADRRTAIEVAAQIRLRPILMTTAAMVLGVVPLVLAFGPGAASRFSIGLVIASGMSVGTLFTLFVLPTVYTFLAEDHRVEAGSARNQQMAAVS